MMSNNKKVSSGLVLVAVLFLLMFHFTVSAQEARPTEELLSDGLEEGAVSTISPEESEERLNDAKILFDRGKIDAAIFLLQQLQEADPTNYKVLFKLGEMAIADRNWAYSISVLRKASFIRPKDIEVRLILMDIYGAYQMPIQSVVVAREILALDPQHVVGTKRLADLFQEQAMLEDEIVTRIKLRRLTPKDYDNLKRLAEVYKKSGDLWEAAKVYEKIREFYPKNNQDLSKLAGIYNKMGESFRVLDVIEQLEKNGQSRVWLKKQAVENLRKQSELYDPLVANIAFHNDKSEELKSTAINSFARFAYLSVRSSIEYAGSVSLGRDSFEGIGDLKGDLDINRNEVVFDAIKTWRREELQLVVSLGVLNDKISGKLSLADPGSGFTANDFPFLKDPTFDSYGGNMTIGGLKLIGQLGIFDSYQIAYEHGQVNDLDARLQMLSFDKIFFDYSYQSNDETSFQATIDTTDISDGNSGKHALLGGSYVLWGKNAIKDFSGKRGKFFRATPDQSVSAGYTVEYFDNKNQSNLYHTLNGETRHRVDLSGQLKVSHLGSDESVFLSFGYAYSTGDTLDSQHNVESRVFYINSENGNEIGVSLAYEESTVDDPTQPNQQINGKSESYIFSVDANLRF